jgi:hypothetical protein
MSLRCSILINCSSPSARGGDVPLTNEGRLPPKPTALRKTTSRYSLNVTSFKVLKWPVLQTFPARICLTFFNFCQPFLINDAIRLSQEAINERTTQIGYGLIGAYVLVYIGIAVCFPAWDRVSELLGWFRMRDQDAVLTVVRRCRWANTSTGPTEP